ncbi:putative sterigmatocystin biosynthesis peroxidase stcC [Lasiodiplodia hormozganensis]|uniref:Sterigmatocystin biosynthesis peroxidase stcC n=1 Tax=Lasiodiplodia hormozganensis TaxID=869390 RepID=A0AA39Z4W8_9PEZI|nr:putative sterigmatocystin biosynthesis peroxidase stcC [Lasiodiplodia hormozganensis]
MKMQLSFGLSIGVLPVALGFSHFAQEGGSLAAQASRQIQNRDSGLKPHHYTWTAPGEDDVRAPCPVLNTLANHEFLPHNGRNITLDKAIDALGSAMNIAPALATTFFNGGLRTNPTPNATWFDFDMLHKHNILEHDGSLSRRDMYFDTSNRFNEDTFDNFLSYFDSNATVLGVNETAVARAKHAYEMSKINPEFTITSTNLPIMVGESVMMMLVWGSVENPGANREFFEYFFRNERLPVELGWTPGSTEIEVSIVQSLSAAMLSASPSDVPLLFSP